MVFLMVSSSPIATAQNSKAYALKARASWNAFGCCSLASKAGESAEQERFFLYGYQQGMTFISALQAQKIKQKGLDSESP